MREAEPYGRVAVLCCLLTMVVCAAAGAYPAGVPKFQPDLSISASPGPFVGEDIHNKTGVGQQAWAKAWPLRPQCYTLRLQNDGWWSDSLKLVGPGSSVSLNVKYFDAPVGGNEITADVTGGGWWTPSLLPTRLVTLRLEVTPTWAADAYTSRTLILEASSWNEQSHRDVVKATTTVGAVLRPDALIKADSEPSFTGQDIYDAWAKGQRRSADTDGSHSAVYLIGLENDGNATDQFLVKSRWPTWDSWGWHIHFYDSIIGGTEITWAVTNGTWLTPPIAKGSRRVIRLELHPTSLVPFGTALKTLVKIESLWAPKKVDAVEAFTRKVVLDDDE